MITKELSVEGTVHQRFEIPMGTFVFVTMTTQADYAYQVKITADNGKVYFDKKRQSNVPTPPINETFQTTGTGVNIDFTITNPPSATVQLRYSTLDVTTPEGEKVASTITYVGEDGCDTDWNDLYLAIAWWKYAG